MPRYKVTQEMIPAFQHMRDARMSYRAIGKLFGVSGWTVSALLAGKVKTVQPHDAATTAAILRRAADQLDNQRS